MARVLLRPVVPADSVAVAPWLAEAEAAIRGRGASVTLNLTLDDLVTSWTASCPGSEILVGVLADGTVAGLMHLAPADGLLHIRALTVRRDLRNLGYGQEMVFGAEQRHPVARLATATVPSGNGLAVYFWLRTGYRPAYPAGAADTVERGDDGTRMARTLDA